MKRDDWMLEGTSKGELDTGADFFSMLGGGTGKKRELPPAPDPDKVQKKLIKSLFLLRFSWSVGEYKLKGVEHAIEGREIAR